MPRIKRNNFDGTLARLHVSVTPEAKDLLEEYAYRSRQTVSKGADTLIREGAARFLAAAAGGSAQAE